MSNNIYTSGSTAEDLHRTYHIFKVGSHVFQFYSEPDKNGELKYYLNDLADPKFKKEDYEPLKIQPIVPISKSGFLPIIDAIDKKVLEKSTEENKTNLETELANLGLC